ncbi:MAG: phosphoadenosine phosphosulfate reductase [Paracoccaceae bacterium]|jgi:phosphoadenosine phosphosulfate reductase
METCIMTRIAVDSTAHRPDAAAMAAMGAAARAAALETAFADASAEDILRAVFVDGVAGPAALVSSFGAESAALLHLLSRAAPDAPVLLLDTLLLFPETLAYQQDLSVRLGLTGVRRIQPQDATLLREDPADDLREHDTDACCDLRKVRPLAAALMPFGAVVSGRKRFQAATRTHLPRFEADADGRIRVNPMANWTSEDVRAHIKTHNLPPHPLVAGGFASIGCAPCTTPVAADEDPRAGRWRGSRKVECGIHFVNGQVVRPSRAA